MCSCVEELGWFSDRYVARPANSNRGWEVQGKISLIVYIPDQCIPYTVDMFAFALTITLKHWHLIDSTDQLLVVFDLRWGEMKIPFVKIMEPTSSYLLLDGFIDVFLASRWECYASLRLAKSCTSICKCSSMTETKASSFWPTSTCWSAAVHHFGSITIPPFTLLCTADFCRSALATRWQILPGLRSGNTGGQVYAPILGF